MTGGTPSARPDGSDPSRVALIGAGALGRDSVSVFHALQQQDPAWRIVGFLDDREDLWGSEFLGVHVLGGGDWLKTAPDDVEVLLTVGSPETRRELDERLTGRVKWARIIHPTAVLTPWVHVDEGVLVMARATFTVDVRLGRHVVVNPGCTVAHDVVVGDYSYLSPGVDLAGRVVLEEGVYMGTGAVAIPGVRIGAGATIGAGAVVIGDVPPGVTAVGVPARALDRP